MIGGGLNERASDARRMNLHSSGRVAVSIFASGWMAAATFCALSVSALLSAPARAAEKPPLSPDQPATLVTPSRVSATIDSACRL
jgi:hypothetical protein